MKKLFLLVCLFGVGCFTGCNDHVDVDVHAKKKVDDKTCCSKKGKVCPCTSSLCTRGKGLCKCHEVDCNCFH